MNHLIYPSFLSCRVSIACCSLFLLCLSVSMRVSLNPVNAPKDSITIPPSLFDLSTGTTDTLYPLGTLLLVAQFTPSLLNVTVTFRTLSLHFHFPLWDSSQYSLCNVILSILSAPVLLYMSLFSPWSLPLHLCPSCCYCLYTGLRTFHIDPGSTLASFLSFLSYLLFELLQYILFYLFSFYIIFARTSFQPLYYI